MSICWLDGWFVSRTAQEILSGSPRNLVWMMDLGPEHDPFTFGVDPDKESDPGNAYSLSLILRDEVFLTSLLIS